MQESDPRSMHPFVPGILPTHGNTGPDLTPNPGFVGVDILLATPIITYTPQYPISVNCTVLVHRIPFLNSPQKPIWEPATALFHKLFVVDCSDGGIQELADCWLSSSLTTSTKHLISAIIHMENQMSI